jgi:hypothetical protein
MTAESGPFATNNAMMKIGSPTTDLRPELKVILMHQETGLPAASFPIIIA